MVKCITKSTQFENPDTSNLKQNLQVIATNLNCEIPEENNACSQYFHRLARTLIKLSTIIYGYNCTNKDNALSTLREAVMVCLTKQAGRRQWLMFQTLYYKLNNFSEQRACKFWITSPSFRRCRRAAQQHRDAIVRSERSHNIKKGLLTIEAGSTGTARFANLLMDTILSFVPCGKRAGFFKQRETFKTIAEGLNVNPHINLIEEDPIKQGLKTLYKNVMAGDKWLQREEVAECIMDIIAQRTGFQQFRVFKAVWRSLSNEKSEKYAQFWMSSIKNRIVHVARRKCAGWSRLSDKADEYYTALKDIVKEAEAYVNQNSCQVLPLIPSSQQWSDDYKKLKWLVTKTQNTAFKQMDKFTILAMLRCLGKMEDLINTDKVIVKDEIYKIAETLDAHAKIRPETHDKWSDRIETVYTKMINELHC